MALLLIGVIGYALNYFLTFIEASYYSYICYGLAGVGFLLIILGFVLKVAYYQFVASGMPEEIAARWRIIGVKTGEGNGIH